MTNILELANVPSVTLIDTDVDNLLSRAVQTYENTYKEQTGEEITLMPADKNRILLQTAVYLVMMDMIAADTMYKQGSLKDATGDSLDAIGSTRGSVERPQSEYAVVPVKYYFDGALTEQQIIPKGNRVSKDNVYFATTEETIVPAGTTDVTLTLQCTVAGVIGNGFLPNTIITHSDPLAWVKSVSNTETSQGGTSPDDDDYTRKIYNTPEGYAVAGPKDAYITKTKEFSTSVQDVAVITPDDAITIEYTYDDNGTTKTETKDVNIPESSILISGSNISSYVLELSEVVLGLNFNKPVSNIKFNFTRGGIVNVYPLLENSQIPNSAFLDELKEALSARTDRPLSDKVNVLAPSESSYTVNFEYYIDAKDANSVELIKSSVNTAVTSYETWQSTYLGRDINPDELIKLVKEAGAKRLVISSPAYTNLKAYQVAKCASTTITYKGLE